MRMAVNKMVVVQRLRADGGWHARQNRASFFFEGRVRVEMYTGFLPKYVFVIMVSEVAVLLSRR